MHQLRSCWVALNHFLLLLFSLIAPACGWETVGWSSNQPQQFDQGFGGPAGGADPGVKARLINLISAVRVLMRSEYSPPSVSRFRFLVLAGDTRWPRRAYMRPASRILYFCCASSPICLPRHIYGPAQVRLLLENDPRAVLQLWNLWQYSSSPERWTSQPVCRRPLAVFNG